MGKITYPRNTTFPITVNYTGASGLHGVTAMFTAKTQEADTDPADISAIVKKDITLTSGTPDTGTGVINPTDVADTVNPGTYFYDVKVLDSSGAIYQIDKGQFVLTADPTNRRT